MISHTRTHTDSDNIEPVAQENTGQPSPFVLQHLFETKSDRRMAQQICSAVCSPETSRAKYHGLWQ